MILEEIRKMQKQILRLREKIASFTVSGCIRYDQEPVKSSVDCHRMENMVLRKIAMEQRLAHLEKSRDMLIRGVDMSGYTLKQQRFIRLYFFRGMSELNVAAAMRVRVTSVSRIKKRVLDKM